MKARLNWFSLFKDMNQYVTRTTEEMTTKDRNRCWCWPYVTYGRSDASYHQQVAPMDGSLFKARVPCASHAAGSRRCTCTSSPQRFSCGAFCIEASCKARGPNEKDHIIHTETCTKSLGSGSGHARGRYGASYVRTLSNRLQIKGPARRGMRARRGKGGASGVPSNLMGPFEAGPF